MTNTNQSFLTIAWRITAVTVLMLLIATIFLTNNARSYKESGFEGQIIGLNATVSLRRQANDHSHIVAILDNGITVYVTDSTLRNDKIWYHVETQAESGWIPEENLAIP